MLNGLNVPALGVDQCKRGTKFLFEIESCFKMSKSTS